MNFYYKESFNLKLVKNRHDSLLSNTRVGNFLILSDQEMTVFIKTYVDDRTQETGKYSD